MLSTMPAMPSAHTVYTDGLTAALRTVGELAALPETPWALLALNAAFYLDDYLSPAAHRVALDRALHATLRDLESWRALGPGTPPGFDELPCLIAAGTPRSGLYGWLFDRAARSTHPGALLLAQHACEIAEVMPDDDLPHALRLGLLQLPRSQSQSIPLPPSEPLSVDALVERLCRTLLRGAISHTRFSDGLLLLHAARRAGELTDGAATETLAAAARLIGALPDAPSAPKRLSVAQPHSLAQYALSLFPRGVLLVEAGLVEANQLNPTQQLLLFAALDRALKRYAKLDG